MKLSEDLIWRGQIKDKTFSDISWLDKPQSFYLGIDASADSLTVGNLAILMLVRRLAVAGWKPYLVMGGGTSLVGDPGGKTEERQLISRETVENNIKGVQGQVTQILHGQEFTLVDNYDWLSSLKYVDFLREVGKHFSMTELMQRDFVVERMGKGGSGISYAEFSYSLVQGYDFWHLFNAHNVVLQIGGSDQWGNLLSGVSLIRKKESKDAHALSIPLVVDKTTGKKFGKSEAGAIWLDANKTLPTQFYQFWFNAGDDDVEDYLKVFTELDSSAIEEIMTKFNQERSNRLAQQTLAYEVTKIVHGEKAAEQAKTDAQNLKTHSIENIISSSKAKVGDSIIDALVSTGLAISKTEARRLLASGGIYINGQSIAREEFESDDFKDGRLMLRKGKTLQNSAVIEQA